MSRGTALGARLRVSGAITMRLASARSPAWTGSKREDMDESLLLIEEGRPPEGKPRTATMLSHGCPVAVRQNGRTAHALDPRPPHARPSAPSRPGAVAGGGRLARHHPLFIRPAAAADARRPGLELCAGRRHEHRQCGRLPAGRAADAGADAA